MAKKIIHVDGLKQFRRNLTDMDKGAGKALRLAMNEAAEVVAEAARPLIPRGPAAGGHAANSLKVASTAQEARVRAGGTKYAYYPWLEFGGKLRKSNVVRRRDREGRYLYPSLDANNDRVYQTLLNALVNLAESSFSEVGSA